MLSEHGGLAAEHEGVDKASLQSLHLAPGAAEPLRLRRLQGLNQHPKLMRSQPPSFLPAVQPEAQEVRLERRLFLRSRGDAMRVQSHENSLQSRLGHLVLGSSLSFRCTSVIQGRHI